MKSSRNFWFGLASGVALFFFFGFGPFSSSPKVVDTLDLHSPDDEEAVKAVIVRETEQFLAANFEKWSATRTHAENNLTIAAGPGRDNIVRGWQKEVANAAWMFKDNPGGVKFEVERTNWNIRVSGNVAWATYDQSITVPQYGMKDRLQTQTRCLEKTGGQWTISVLTYTDDLPTDTPETEEAIKKVCAAETQAWLDKDYQAWAAHHLQSPEDNLVACNGDCFFISLEGWMAIDAEIKTRIETGKKQGSKLTHDSFRFTIQGNMAYVSYNQTQTDPTTGNSDHSREHRVLLFEAGRWKIQSVLAFWNHKK